MKAVSNNRGNPKTANTPDLLPTYQIRTFQSPPQTQTLYRVDPSYILHSSSHANQPSPCQSQDLNKGIRKRPIHIACYLTSPPYPVSQIPTTLSVATQAGRAKLHMHLDISRWKPESK